MMQPIVPPHVYYWVYGALLALTLLTVGVAFVDLGPLSLILALGIAICKALLVMLFFMHLRYSGHLTWLVAGAGVIWLAHLLIFTLSDYLTRGWLPVSGR
jgi:cytochrome c oxidase subunit IV